MGGSSIAMPALIFHVADLTAQALDMPAFQGLPVHPGAGTESANS
jgi:hypothetical protein